MSKRNSAEAKRAARERIRAEREREARRARIRRRLVVAGAALAIVGVVGAVGAAVAGRNGGSADATDWEAVRAQVDGEAAEGATTYPKAAPRHASGEDGLTVRVGDPDAEHTLTLYEDPRCPACQYFEEEVGRRVRHGIEEGTFRVEYVFGTFLDDRLQGTGSKNALNALGAALDVSTEAFLDYHDALYSADNHPAETNDAFADDEYLIEIAQQVPELRDNRAFARNVRNDTFAVWALRMSDTFDADPDVTATPTLAWDGEIVTELPQTAEDFDRMVAERTD